MKRIQFFLIPAVLAALLALQCYAQENTFSAWSVDPNNKTLKTRYFRFQATDGYSYIRMEVKSDISCSMLMTSTVCNADAQGVNGYKKITLRRNEVKTVYFRIMNTCSNGWWWWYRDYKDLRATY